MDIPDPAQLLRHVGAAALSASFAHQPAACMVPGNVDSML